MSKPRMFEKPSGVRDYLPEAVRKLREIERKVLHTMECWGYAQIITPTMEFYDTVGTASATSDQKLFKLLNQRGTPMVLRSDMTGPIARVVSSLLGKEPFPIRLSYHANVFRAMEEEAGREAEFFQTGAELAGDGSPEADAEVIALAIACLKASGIERFKVALGHHGVVQSLFEDALPGDEENQLRLKQLLIQRDVVGYRAQASLLGLDGERIEPLEALLQLRGGRAVLDQARALSGKPEMAASLAHLEQVWEVLEAYGVAEHLLLDLTMLGDFSYYTGTIFEGYAADMGFPVMSGGRYDHLLQQFGRPAPATGFALKTTRIIDALSRPGENEEEQAKPVLIQYEAARRADALAEAARLRAEGVIAVTRLLGDDAAGMTSREGSEAEGQPQDGRYREVLTFVQP
ncbi:ATP phosphoribosyltransferase regulatory subunit [Paenibacillus dendritiformis]|uniref:ATP phosphoribosyltransferase regulatory subunit n=1 Tax=Paenibacillus dendritiformis TaxID=130049 RepID=UPI00248BD839|nr:ATP phosphoribosyltransferase regulatory subunit [Paenibacillus dendritiformis]WGU93165.1 ATP phosphoribosyltransferase regulatory subunit [Paenibacillus dendritiformis]